MNIEDFEILAIQKTRNNRPRKTLNYRTPNDVIRERQTFSVLHFMIE
ncbi:MAG: hypothetical protein HAW62_03925 [Endozoicomonadaceae bacterium]|nr:hypothetical protein [Endozoicomonadaceae bacterium]